MPVTDAQARRFVAGYYGRRAGDVRTLGAGEWSQAYAFVLDGREAVQALLSVSQETARVPGWRAALAASPVGTGPFDRGYATLRELAGGLPDVRHVIHGDLVNHNVLVQGSRITAVIDWGNALYGDWLYDAAWLMFWWPWFPQWRDIDIGAELERHWEQRGSPPPGLHHRLRACLVHIGLDAMAYDAYRRRWDDLARTASQLSRLI